MVDVGKGPTMNKINSWKTIQRGKNMRKGKVVKDEGGRQKMMV